MMQRMSDYSIGVDLGGTNLRAAAISSDGKMLNKVAVSTAVGSGRNAVIQDIVRAVETLQAGRSGDTLAGVGVGIPGYILMDKGVVVGAPNLPEFENYPVRDDIEQRLGAKVIHFAHADTTASDGDTVRADHLLSIWRAQFLRLHYRMRSSASALSGR